MRSHILPLYGDAQKAPHFHGQFLDPESNYYCARPGSGCTVCVVQWEALSLYLMGVVGHLQGKNGALQAANKVLQDAAEAAKAAQAQLEERAASFEKLKVSTCNLDKYPAFMHHSPGPHHKLCLL